MLKDIMSQIKALSTKMTKDFHHLEDEVKDLSCANGEEKLLGPLQA